MDPSEIIERLVHLPCRRQPEERICGTIKTVPGHFRVAECMPYAPCGSGEHVYVTLTRSGWNTPDVGRRLAKLLHVPMRDVGWAGLKDRQAMVSQTFSLKMSPKAALTDIRNRLTEHTDFDIVSVDRHRNKIRRGHVRANRFRIVVGPPATVDRLDSARAIADDLCASGMPNFYGTQRFGQGYSNVTRAAAGLRSGRMRTDRQRSFWISVLQAAAFNIWLAERMDRGEFSRIFVGDIAKKTDTGGLFMVQDAAEAAQRLAQRALTYTGPIYGAKTMPAGGVPGRIESELRHRLHLDQESLKKLKAPGSRRTALLWIDAINIAVSAEGLVFTFELPAGCYATVLLNEFLQPSDDRPPGDRNR